LETIPNKAPRAVQELFILIGMANNHARIRKPKMCAICGVMKDNWYWHMKLYHDKWDVVRFQETMYGDKIGNDSDS
jgi:hypothetical protein